jgi:hypothetical protein
MTALAAAMTWTELLNRLSTAPERAAALTADLGQAACVRPSRDEWSVCEIIGHMCAIESPYRARLARMTLEDDPRVAAIGCITGDYDPETPVTILLETLAMLRRETVALLENLTPMARARPGIHAELGPVTLRSQVDALSAHDEEHVAQIAALVSQHKDTKTKSS